ncbi:MATE family efflux transporter [candidate division KSB1 bacterium]|nr:MATE family efflux transporter [candidate division KSB1 bacterium]
MNNQRIQLFHNFQNCELRQALARSWAMSWPMTVIMFFEFLITLADVYIAGKIGKEIQAAYGFVTQIYFIFTVIGNAFTVGSVSVISRLCPEHESQEFADAISSSLITTFGAGIVLGTAGIFLSPLIINFLNVPQEIKGVGIPLISIYAAGIIFHYVLINTNGLLRACKGIKVSLRTMAVVCVLNIILNFTFVFYTPLGYKGIALSTAISVFIGSLINVWHLKKILFKRKKYAGSIIKTVIKIGWPSGLLQVVWQMGATVLFLILSALPENRVEILAAFTNGYRIEAAIFLPAFAFNMANAVVVGNLLGEKKKDEAFRNGLTTAGLGVIVITLLSAIVLLNARFIVSFLSTNEIVINYSIKYLFICLAFEPIMAWGIILGGGLNGAGDTFYVMVSVALSVWLIRVPLSLILGLLLNLGAPGVWWAMNGSILAQAILISGRYLKRRWLQNA